jgi:putative solute:sodium symporter small subunit
MPRVPPPDSDRDRSSEPEPGSTPGSDSAAATAYWRANLRVMGCLLAVWAFVSYGLGIVFSEALDAYRIGGFPLGFWFGQQGAIYVFVVLIFVYAIWMDRLDRRYDRTSTEAEPEGS